MTPLDPITQPPRRPHRHASSWSRLGQALVAVGSAAMFLAGRLARIAPEGFELVVLLAGTFLGVLCVRVGARCLIKAKRLRAANALDILADDHRPPIVYFRSFLADEAEGRQIAFGAWHTHEEELAAAMSDIGPLVAFGIPQESPPRIGAARLYASDSQWQASARDLMARAAIVLVRISRGPSFWWEFTTAVRNVAPQKIVLLVPRDRALYDGFRVDSASILPRALPSLQGWRMHKLFRGNLRALIYFDAAWSPFVVDVQAIKIPWLHYAPHMPLATVLQAAFRPICENSGLSWKQPGTNRRMVITIVAFAVMIFCIGVQWWLAS